MPKTESNTISKLIIITGRNLKHEDSFYPFLVKELGQELPNVFDITILAIEDYNNPQAWSDAIEAQNSISKFDTNTYVVAHSAGALAFCRFLQDNNIEIRSLHIIGGVFDENLHPNQGEGGPKMALGFDPSSLDYTKIGKSAWQIHIHHSIDDDRVDYNNALRYKQAFKKAVLHHYTGRQHFRDSQPFEELTKSIIEQYHQGFASVDARSVEIYLLPASQLPLVLPTIADYAPTTDGSSPLKKSDWYKKDSETGNTVYHEADTMPNWAGSSWYYLRFCDPRNQQEFASQENLAYWLPVDHYFGGSEHTTVHLLYSRFWHRFLYNLGHIPNLENKTSYKTLAEPYQKRTNGGIMLGSDGTKMSKSKGNGANPKEKLDEVGADALRLYICFIGPYEATVIWQDGGLKACKKLVETIFNLHQKVDKSKTYEIIDNSNNSAELVFAYHIFIKNLTGQIKEHKLNVAIAEIMTFTNFLKTLQSIDLPVWKNFLLAIAPFAPFTAEELWFNLFEISGQKSEKNIDNYISVHLQTFPSFDEALCQKTVTTIAIQINGKMRASFEIQAEATEADIMGQARIAGQKWLTGKTEKFVKIIPNKLVSFVVD